MRTKYKNPLLGCISNIYEHSGKSQLKPELFKKIDNDLKIFSKYLEVTKSQAFITALIFSLSYKGNSVDIKDLKEYLECNPIHILEYVADFEALYSSGIVCRSKAGYRNEPYIYNYQYNIVREVVEAILTNTPLTKPREREKPTIVDVLEELYDIGQKGVNDGIDFWDMWREIHEKIKDNCNYPLIKRVVDMNLGFEEPFLFFYLVWKTLIGQESAEISDPVNLLFDRTSDRIKFTQAILEKRNSLIRNDLIEVVGSDYSDSAEIKLTQKAISFVEESGVKLFVKKIKSGAVIAPTDIQPKDLFFNESEKSSLDMIYNVLKHENLLQLQKKISEKNLPVGITALLHGQPGTGKTETVYQVAKATNREIYQVDISKTKSCWFGESEKIIKRVFTEYNSYAKQCDVTPILLLNEADAVISKRKSVSSSNVAQTENAIQNIILEELEKFKGILIATTNLVDNIDPAFDRRFLFKVEFSKPSISVKSKIWKSKLPDLSVDECDRLSEMFDLSGGQIDNIVRKCEMHELLNSEKTPFSKLVEFCKSEQLITVERSKVGFTRKSA